MFVVFNFLILASALAAAYALLTGGPLPAQVAALPLAVRGVLALAIMALGIRGYAAQRRAGAPRPASARRATRNWIDLASAVGIWLVIHAGFLWLLGASPRPIERLGLAAEPWLRPDNARHRLDLADEADGDVRSGNWLWQDRRSRSLPLRTNLRPGNRPEVFVRFTRAEDAAMMVNRHTYLSSFALSQYAQGRWTTPPGAPVTMASAEDGSSDFEAYPGRAEFPLVVHEVFHGSNAENQNVLTTLQGVESATIAPLDRYDDGFVMLPEDAATGLGFRYFAQSRPLAIADLPADLRVEPPVDAADWLTAQTENPRVAAHLLEQAREILGETPTIGSLVRLEQWFQSAFDYSLQTLNPLDLDSLENFLFSERAGHCEHFAMTAALMLRSLGIPTRVAYGWAGGTWYESAGLLVFRSREAHAWTEVLLPDFGWVIVDPTPPSGIDGTRSRVAPPDEPPPDPTEELGEETVLVDDSRIDRAATMLLGIFGLPVLVLLAMRARMRGRATGADDPGAPGRAIGGGYLAAWHGACPPRFHGETMRRQIRRMRPPPPFAERLIDYHYKIRYTSATRDSSIERRLERDIRDWQQSRSAADFTE